MHSRSHVSDPMASEGRGCASQTQSRNGQSPARFLGRRPGFLPNSMGSPTWRALNMVGTKKTLLEVSPVAAVLAIWLRGIRRFR